MSAGRRSIAPGRAPGRAPGLGLPAYVGPWETEAWAEVLAQRPAVVVVNPANGPGARRLPGYRSLVHRLRAGGTTVLGYVAVGWLRDEGALGLAQRDAQRHHDWYGTDGCFFDEVPADPQRGLLDALESLRASTDACALNPGRTVPPSWYRRLPDVTWVTFEGRAGDYLARASGDGPTLRTGVMARQWHLVHGCRRADVDAVHAAASTLGVGLLHATTGRLPNPWAPLRLPTTSQLPAATHLPTRG